MPVVPFGKRSGILLPNGCRGQRAGAIALYPCIIGSGGNGSGGGDPLPYCPAEMRASFCTNEDRQAVPTLKSPDIGGQVYPTGGSPFPTPQPICDQPL